VCWYVLPLYPPPKGESFPNQFLVKIIFQFASLSVVYSGQKIFDFLYSPFGGGVRGRIFKTLIFMRIKKHVIGTNGRNLKYNLTHQFMGFMLYTSSPTKQYPPTTSARFSVFQNGSCDHNRESRKNVLVLRICSILPRLLVLESMHRDCLE